MLIYHPLPEISEFRPFFTRYSYRAYIYRRTAINSRQEYRTCAFSLLFTLRLQPLDDKVRLLLQTPWDGTIVRAVSSPTISRRLVNSWLDILYYAY